MSFGVNNSQYADNGQIKATDNDNNDVVFLGESPGFRNQQPPITSPVNPNQPMNNYQNQNYQQQSNFQAINNATPKKRNRNSNDNFSPVNQAQPQGFSPITTVQTPQAPRHRSISLEGLYNQIQQPPNNFTQYQSPPPFNNRGGASRFPQNSTATLRQNFSTQQQLRLNSPAQQQNYPPRQRHASATQQNYPSTPTAYQASPRQPTAATYQINNSPTCKITNRETADQRQNIVNNQVVNITDSPTGAPKLPPKPVTITKKLQIFPMTPSKLVAKEQPKHKMHQTSTESDDTGQKRPCLANGEIGLRSDSETAHEKTDNSLDPRISMPNNPQMISENVTDVQNDPSKLVLNAETPEGPKDKNSTKIIEDLLTSLKEKRVKEAQTEAPIVTPEPVVRKRRGRPKKQTPEIYVERAVDSPYSDITDDSIGETYSPAATEINQSDSEDEYKPCPKKRKSKVKTTPQTKTKADSNAFKVPENKDVNPPSTECESEENTDAVPVHNMEEIGTWNTNVLDNLVLEKNAEASTQQDSIISTNIETDSVPKDINIDHTEIKLGENKIPLALRLHHSKMSEDQKLKTFKLKNLTASVRKAKLNATRAHNKNTALSDKLSKIVIEKDNCVNPSENLSTVKLPKKRGRKKKISPIIERSGQNKIIPPSIERRGRKKKIIPIIEPVASDIEAPAPEGVDELPDEQNVCRTPSPNLPDPAITTSPPEQDETACTSTERCRSPVINIHDIREKNITDSPKKRKKFKKEGVTNHVGAVISGLFGGDFLSSADAHGFVVNIRLDVEKKMTESPMNLSEKQESNIITDDPINPNSNSRAATRSRRASHLKTSENWDPNFFTNSELISILKKRILDHPHPDSDMKHAIINSFMHANKFLDEQFSPL